MWPQSAHYPFSGQLVYTTDSHPTQNLTGKVLLYDAENLLHKEEFVDRLKDSGLSALILAFPGDTKYPGLIQYSRTQLEPTKNPFPVFEITSRQNKSLEGWWKNQTALFVSFNFEEPSPWDKVFFHYVPVFANLLLVFSGLIMIMAGYKLLLLVLVNGIQLSIAQLVLLFNFISIALRFAWCASDPVGAYGRTPFLWVQIGMSLPFSFCISGALLITLYWHEMIIRTGPKINLFLNKMLVPFLIVAGIIFGIELATGIARGLAARVPILVIIDGIIYAVIVVATLIFFIVTKIRLSAVFKKLNTNLNQGKGRKLAIASNIVVGISIVMVLWVIALILLGTGKIIWTPPGFVVIWTVLLLGMNVMCLLQVLLIRAPYRPWKWIFCGLCSSDPDALLSEDSTAFSMVSSKNSQGSHSLGA
jgi:hypothetical protein